jgi:DNA-directed RNA polymerase subunit RPC12/RpoP
MQIKDLAGRKNVVKMVKYICHKCGVGGLFPKVKKVVTCSYCGHAS